MAARGNSPRVAGEDETTNALHKQMKKIPPSERFNLRNKGTNILFYYS